VNIISDPFDPTKVLTQHPDGDGSKLVQRLLVYLETEDEKVFAGMADDAISMNTGDIAAAGFVSYPYIMTNVLNVNMKKELKERVMRQIAGRLIELRELYASNGINVKFLSGETADLPDQVRSGVLDVTVTSWADKDKVISGNIQDGDLIFGLASDGQAAWETEENSGIMSNGETMARGVLMHCDYDNNLVYPQLKRDGEFYRGNFHYGDCPDILQNISVSAALLSPTRQWAIFIKHFITELKNVGALDMLHGITMNTGGGATKIGHLGTGGIEYIKKMPVPPPIFRLIQTESGESWENMYRSFNCGVGLDVVGEDNSVFVQSLEKVSGLCHIPLYRLGSCRRMIGRETEPNLVSLQTPYGAYKY